jgi:hypothetical protein
MYRVPPTTVLARIATATGRRAQVSDRRGETPVAVKPDARVSWFSLIGDQGFESVSLQHFRNWHNPNSRGNMHSARYRVLTEPEQVLSLVGNTPGSNLRGGKQMTRPAVRRAETVVNRLFG